MTAANNLPVDTPPFPLNTTFKYNSRLGPDGKRISFVIQVPDNRESEVPYLDLIQTYWRDVGIDMRYELAARDIVEQRVRNNMHDATVWVGVGGLDVILAPRHYLPASWQAFNVSYAVAWAEWYINTEGKLSEEPPTAIQEQMVLYNQIKSTADTNLQAALMHKILKIAADQFYVIGVCTPGREIGIVKNNFHNVPNIMPSSWTYPNPAPTNPAQFFIEKDK